MMKSKLGGPKRASRSCSKEARLAGPSSSRDCLHLGVRKIGGPFFLLDWKARVCISSGLSSGRILGAQSHKLVTHQGPFSLCVCVGLASAEIRTLTINQFYVFLLGCNLARPLARLCFLLNLLHSSFIIAALGARTFGHFCCRFSFSCCCCCCFKCSIVTPLSF